MDKIFSFFRRILLRKEGIVAAEIGIFKSSIFKRNAFFTNLVFLVFSIEKLIQSLISTSSFLVSIYVVLLGSLILLIALVLTDHANPLVMHGFFLAMIILFLANAVITRSVEDYIFCLSIPIIAGANFGKKATQIIFVLIFLGALPVFFFQNVKTIIPETVYIVSSGLICIFTICGFSFLAESREEKIEEILNIKIYKDPLTGLFNRKRLNEDLHCSPEPVMAILNIDDFKEINTTFGYETGDTVLKLIAEKLLSFGKKHFFSVYKLSADEFALIWTGTQKNPNRLDLDKLLFQLITEIQNCKYIIQKQEIYLRLSAGAAFSADAGKANLFICTDIALKTAKTGMKTVVLYEDAMIKREDVSDNMLRLNVFSKAMEENRIIPYFQPIVCNRSGVIEKYECLVRIRKENGDLVLPDAFLDVAKKTRKYNKLTCIVMEKAFLITAPTAARISVNISILDILDGNFLGMLEDLFFRFPQMKGRLVLEIVESEGFEKYEAVEAFIKRVKKFGCKIAIDDFGTGYSNFEHLFRLSPDYLKLDGSLVRDLDHDEKAIAITSSIVHFAKKIGIQIIAEYVHSRQVFEKVRELGVDYSQGFYFGKPEAIMALGLNLPILN